MRFLYFPLPLLLILCSFVSIDSQAAPQSVSKPVPPWSTHKPRLKRSIDDSNSTADYDSLSLDQLTNLLEETKKTAENEKMNFDAAAEAWRSKKDEVDKATEDYDKKKTEWDKWKDYNDWRNKSAEAQKIISDHILIYHISSLEEKYLRREKLFLDAETKVNKIKDELADLNGQAEGKDVVTPLNDELAGLPTAIDTMMQTVTRLEAIKTEKEGVFTPLQGDVTYYRRKYNEIRCNDHQKATVAPCPDTIAKLDQAKRDLPAAKDAAERASRNYKDAVNIRNILKSRKSQIESRLLKIGRNKDKIPEMKEFRESLLNDAKWDKDYYVEGYLEAKRALQTAELTLANAEKTNTEADQKLSEYPKNASTQESEANIAQDEAGKEKTRLEGELATLKSDRDEKEKQLKATSAKVAELERAETAKKSAVSTGGTNPVAIIVPIVVVIILGLLGAALFVFLKRRKRIAKQAKAPEADSQNPTVASQKPPSDPAAAPQPECPPIEERDAAYEEIKAAYERAARPIAGPV